MKEQHVIFVVEWEHIWKDTMKITFKQVERLLLGHLSHPTSKLQGKTIMLPIIRICRKKIGLLR